MTLTEIQQLIATEVTRLDGDVLVVIPTEETQEQYLGVVAWRSSAKPEAVTHLYSVRKDAEHPTVLLLQGHYMSGSKVTNDFFVICQAASRFFDETPWFGSPSQTELNRIVSRATPAKLQTALRRIEDHT